MRLSFNDLIIYLLLLVVVVSFPIDLFRVNIIYQYLIAIGLRLLLLIFYIYVIRKNRVKIFGFLSFKELPLFLPLFLICFSNPLSSLFSGGFYLYKINGLVITLNIVLCILSVINEEIIFRLCVHNFFIRHTPVKRIVFSALIFALCHLINVVSARSTGAVINVLIQSIYTFGLGLVVAFAYEFSHSLTLAVLLHLFFNLFNDNMYRFLGGYTTTLSFILTASIIGLITGIYMILIYRFYFRKKVLIYN